MKKKNIILITLSLLLIAILTACGEKLELTKANVQKVFKNNYDVEVASINSTNKNISAVFNSKKDIQKDKAKDNLAQIKTTLQKKIDISDNNLIEIKLNKHTLIKDNYGKIQIGEPPKINIKESLSPIRPVYSISNKFNLLNLEQYNIKVIATDYEDGNLTNKIKIKNNDVLTKLGTQTLIYEVTDSDGNNVINNTLKIEVIK